MAAPRGADPGRGPVVVWVRAPVAPWAIPGLCARAGALLRASGADRLVCRLEGRAADVATVEALARLRLTAKRLGCRIEVVHVCPRLPELLDLMGLREVVPARRASGREPEGEPEQREQPPGVEEERDPGDPSP